MEGHWKTISSKVKFHNPWWLYIVDVFQTGTGAQGEYHKVKTRGSSMVVPVFPDGRVLMIRQYRYVIGRWSWEFPCGQLKEHESFEECARSELAEETGFCAGELSTIGQFAPYNGIVDDWCRVYLAAHLTEGKSAPEFTEEIEVATRRPDEIETMLRAGELIDGQTIAAWSLARPHMRL